MNRLKVVVRSRRAMIRPKTNRVYTRRRTAEASPPVFVSNSSTRAFYGNLNKRLMSNANGKIAPCSIQGLFARHCQLRRPLSSPSIAASEMFPNTCKMTRRSIHTCGFGGEHLNQRLIRHVWMKRFPAHLISRNSLNLVF